MNFVLELSCEAFIRLHARCRRERLRDGAGRGIVP